VSLVGVGTFLRFSKEVGLSLPLNVESVTDDQSLFRRELYAAQTTLIVRFYEVCENFGCCFSAFDDHTIGQIKLIVCWILRHKPVPVALVQRVHVLVYDGLRSRLFPAAKIFADFVKPHDQGGLCGIKFSPEQTLVVGETLNIQWKAEADFLAEPYKGSDAYETHDGLMVAMVSTFRGSDLKMKSLITSNALKNKGPSLSQRGPFARGRLFSLPVTRP